MKYIGNTLLAITSFFNGFFVYYLTVITPLSFFSLGQNNPPSYGWWFWMKMLSMLYLLSGAVFTTPLVFFYIGAWALLLFACRQNKTTLRKENKTTFDRILIFSGFVLAIPLLLYIWGELGDSGRDYFG